MTREEREYAIDIIQSILDKYEENECLVAEITIGDEDIEALKLAIKALEQLPKLQNRCFALTQGQICMFCPYDCENRTTEHRSEENGNDD